MTTASPPALRIAVVGSGISGLSAAWLLGKAHDVTLYEKSDRLGGHSHTVTANLGDESVAVDTGFIVYNERTYPNLTALFAHLRVKTAYSDMSFGVSLDGGEFEYSSNSPLSYVRDPSILVNRRFWSVVREVVRFYRTGPAEMRALADQGLSLGEFLDRCGYGREFQEDHLLPQAAAIWSCTVHEIRDYPATSFIAFCDSHGLMNFLIRPLWRTVVGGSHAYVQAIAQSFAGEIRAGAGAVSIRREDGKVRLRDASGGEDIFDHVVIAAHADQALAMLDDADADERQLLSAFSYTRNEAVLHTDPVMMPKKRNWWSSWNYLGHTGDHSEATVSYWMNRLQPLATKADLFVTLNPPSRLALKGEIRRETYEHPLFDTRALDAQGRLWSLQGMRNTWFCGAYFGHGFHEDGLQSGLAVAEQLGGVRRPWTVAGESDRIPMGAAQQRRRELVRA
jgi:predicted NAD/FAD-binding protein